MPVYQTNLFPQFYLVIIYSKSNLDWPECQRVFVCCLFVWHHVSFSLIFLCLIYRFSRHSMPQASLLWCEIGYCSPCQTSLREHRWPWPCGASPASSSLLPPPSGSQLCILTVLTFLSHWCYFLVALKLTPAVNVPAARDEKQKSGTYCKECTSVEAFTGLNARRQCSCHKNLTESEGVRWVWSHVSWDKDPVSHDAGHDTWAWVQESLHCEIWHWNVKFLVLNSPVLKQAATCHQPHGFQRRRGCQPFLSSGHGFLPAPDWRGAGPQGFPISLWDCGLAGQPIFPAASLSAVDPSG